MESVSVDIPGYLFGNAAVKASPVTVEDLTRLKISAGFTADDERWLRVAGAVLKEQTSSVVSHWRSGIIAGIPHLARHSRAPDGSALPQYLARSNHRFEQWILDTCLRAYDQDWLNYQHEIALRHTSLKKNQTDGVRSTPFVPLDDVIAFTAVMNQTIKAFLAAKGHSPDEVDCMHQAWCKSLQLQLALWTHAYRDSARADAESRPTD